MEAGGGIDRQLARWLYKRIKIDSRIGPMPLGIEPNIEVRLFCWENQG